MKYKYKIIISSIIGMLAGLLIAFPVLAVPTTVTVFYAKSSDTSIMLTWVIPTGATSVSVNYKTTGYPANPTDGTVVVNDKPQQTTVTGLIAGTPYYFTAWGYDGALYSVSPAQITVNTTAASSISGGFSIPTPTVPPNFTQAPSGISLQRLEPFYSMASGFIADWQMPPGNGAMGLFLIFVTVISIIVYIKLKTMFVALIVSLMMLFIGSQIGLAQSWMLMIPLFVGAGTWGLEHYFQ
jgi:hypothetical protein